MFGRGAGGFGKQLIKQASQDQKAMIESEEWIKELRRFDFDRIHSTTNLRALILIQLLEELLSQPTKTIWLHFEKMEISSFMYPHILFHLTSFGRQVLLVKAMALLDLLHKKMEILFFMTTKTQFFGNLTQVAKEKPLTLLC